MDCGVFRFAPVIRLKEPSGVSEYGQKTGIRVVPRFSRPWRENRFLFYQPVLGGKDEK